MAVEEKIVTPMDILFLTPDRKLEDSSFEANGYKNGAEHKNGLVLPFVVKISQFEHPFGHLVGQRVNYIVEAQNISPDRLLEILQRTSRSVEETELKYERQQLLAKLRSIDQRLSEIDYPQVYK